MSGPFTISINSTDGSKSPCVPSSNGTACINQLTIFWGCLPAGTPVVMADGSVKRVEDVLVGDQVLADAGGRVLTVTGTLIGTEADPLVAVTDDRGNRLSMTRTHPVVTGRGVVQADHLAVGDVLQTQDGASRVTKDQPTGLAGAGHGLQPGARRHRRNLRRRRHHPLRRRHPGGRQQDAGPPRGDRPSGPAGGRAPGVPRRLPRVGQSQDERKK